MPAAAVRLGTRSEATSRRSFSIPRTGHRAPASGSGRGVGEVEVKVRADLGAVADGLGEGVKGSKRLASARTGDEVEYGDVSVQGLVPRRARHIPVAMRRIGLLRAVDGGEGEGGVSGWTEPKYTEVTRRCSSLGQASTRTSGELIQGVVPVRSRCWRARSVRHPRGEGHLGLAVMEPRGLVAARVSVRAVLEEEAWRETWTGRPAAWRWRAERGRQ